MTKQELTGFLSLDGNIKLRCSLTPKRKAVGSNPAGDAKAPGTQVLGAYFLLLHYSLFIDSDAFRFKRVNKTAYTKYIATSWKLI